MRNILRAWENILGGMVNFFVDIRAPPQKGGHKRFFLKENNIFEDMENIF